ncbi:MAG: flagellar brake protein [Chthonomonadales bacterium]
MPALSFAFLDPMGLARPAATILHAVQSLHWSSMALVGLGVLLALLWLYGRRIYWAHVSAALTKDLGGEIRATSSIKNSPSATLRPVGVPEPPLVRTEVLQVQRSAILLRLVEGDERFLERNQAVLVTVAAPTSAYQFYATVLSVEIAEDVQVRVTRPPWVARIQRRQFFRVGVDLPTMVSVSGGGSGSEEFYCGAIRDISASGARIGVPTQLKADTRITVRIPITDERGTLFHASVLECRRAPKSEPYPYVAQCAFTDLSCDTQELLLRYCFDLQRKHMLGDRASKREAG